MAKKKAKKRKRTRKSLGVKLAESEEKRTAADAVVAEHENTIRKLEGVGRVTEAKVEKLAGQVTGYEIMLTDAQAMIGRLLMQSDADGIDLANSPPDIKAWSAVMQTRVPMPGMPDMDIKVKAVHVDRNKKPE